MATIKKFDKSKKDLETLINNAIDKKLFNYGFTKDAISEQIRMLAEPLLCPQK